MIEVDPEPSNGGHRYTIKLKEGNVTGWMRGSFHEVQRVIQEHVNRYKKDLQITHDYHELRNRRYVRETTLKADRARAERRHDGADSLPPVDFSEPGTEPVQLALEV